MRFISFLGKSAWGRAGSATYITLLISLSFVVFKLNLQNQGSVALNGTINALRRCGESPPISVFVPVARILDQNFTT